MEENASPSRRLAEGDSTSTSQSPVAFTSASQPPIVYTDVSQTPAASASTDKDTQLPPAETLDMRVATGSPSSHLDLLKLDESTSAGDDEQSLGAVGGEPLRVQSLSQSPAVSHEGTEGERPTEDSDKRTPRSGFARFKAFVTGEHGRCKVKGPESGSGSEDSAQQRRSSIFQDLRAFWERKSSTKPKAAEQQEITVADLQEVKTRVEAVLGEAAKSVIVLYIDVVRMKVIVVVVNDCVADQVARTLDQHQLSDTTAVWSVNGQNVEQMSEDRIYTDTRYACGYCSFADTSFLGMHMSPSGFKTKKSVPNCHMKHVVTGCGDQGDSVRTVIPSHQVAVTGSRLYNVLKVGTNAAVNHTFLLKGSTLSKEDSSVPVRVLKNDSVKNMLKVWGLDLFTVSSVGLIARGEKDGAEGMYIITTADPHFPDRGVRDYFETVPEGRFMLNANTEQSVLLGNSKGVSRAGVILTTIDNISRGNEHRLEEDRKGLDIMALEVQGVPTCFTSPNITIIEDCEPRVVWDAPREELQSFLEVLPYRIDVFRYDQHLDTIVAGILSDVDAVYRCANGDSREIVVLANSKKPFADCESRGSLVMTMMNNEVLGLGLVRKNLALDVREIKVPEMGGQRLLGKNFTVHLSLLTPLYEGLEALERHGLYIYRKTVG